MWKSVEGFGLATSISDLIRQWDERFGRLPSLTDAPNLLVFSDYSGDHKGSRYQVISFLIVDPRSWDAWERTRLELRSRLSIGKRRMSFKSLNDSRRRAALYSYLGAAGDLRGICVTFAIHRSIKSLFGKDRTPNPKSDGFVTEALWTSEFFRTCHADRALFIDSLGWTLRSGAAHPLDDRP